jgi:DNA-binding NarL/FixJ family response regulator
MIKIIICDDHRIIREGIKQMLITHEEFVFSGEAESGEQLLGKLRKEQYDVLLLDISLPGRSGLDILKEIKSLYPKMPVLILSMFDEEKYAIRMLKAGASGYLHKDSSPEQLIKAIHEIHDGNIYLSSKASRIMVKHLNQSENEDPHEILSDREFEILILLGRGLSGNEISQMLSLSNKTISTYKSRLMQKMNFENTNDLIQYVISKDLA